MQVDSAVFPPHKKMLKLITQKFRAQSLNEVQPYEPQVPTNEIGDYGSDSEEENHEVEHYLKEKRTCNSSAASAVQNNNVTIVHNNNKPLRPLEDSSNSTKNIQNQANVEKEKHSSEEELLIYDRPPPEKRKYSQVYSWGMVSETNSSSSSSDDEVKELCYAVKTSPIQFGSSPPKHVPRLVRRHADSNNLTFATCPPVCEISAPPRKRHRQGYTIERHYLQSGRCMDFEKMQKQMKRYTNGISSSRGAKVVRIKSITLNNMSKLPPRLLCDPAVFSFKSLSSINQMTPVEEPVLAAF